MIYFFYTLFQPTPAFSFAAVPRRALLYQYLLCTASTVPTQAPLRRGASWGAGVAAGAGGRARCREPGPPPQGPRRPGRRLPGERRGGSRATGWGTGTGTGTGPVRGAERVLSLPSLIFLFFCFRQVLLGVGGGEGGFFPLFLLPPGTAALQPVEIRPPRIR